MKKFCRNRFCLWFVFKISGVSFFTIGNIWGMVGPIDVRQSEDASVRFWINYETLTFDLTHDLDTGFGKATFRSSSRELLSDWCKLRNENKSSRHWAGCMTLVFYHTRMDLEDSRPKFEIAYLTNVKADWNGTEGIWVDHSWQCPWPLGYIPRWAGCMYRTMTGVRSQESFIRS